MTLIGICGKLGSGKDYVASKYIIPYLQSKYGLSCLRLSFADQIKVNVMTMYNATYEDVYIKKTVDSRRLLQREGTELGRNILGKDIWIKYYDAWAKVHLSRGTDVIVASDVRFVNEVTYIKEHGGVLVKVIAPMRNEQRLQQESGGNMERYNAIRNHSSECDLDNLDNNTFDVVLCNDIYQTMDTKALYNILDKKVNK